MTDNKIILEAIKKNKDFLLDVDRIVDDYFETMRIYNPDKKLYFSEGDIALSIVYTAFKFINDDKFIKWCNKKIKEESNV
jgi:hypothetical protein